jgi:putative transcription antitermination factor YqgF
MKYLAIDFGVKHLGLALADGPLAEPFGEKINNVSTFEYLRQLVKTEAIDKIVIGLAEGNLADLIKKFGAKLSQVTGKEIIYCDETLSTQEAKQKLIAAGKPMLKRRLDHAAAAALILQDFLDMMG